MRCASALNGRKRNTYRFTVDESEEQRPLYDGRVDGE
jgi:hypothetical protein